MKSLRCASWVLAAAAALAWTPAASGQYLLTPAGTPPTGAALQIGTGLPLPALAPFTGGTTPATAGPPFWPALPIAPLPDLTPMGATRSIVQTGGTSAGGAVVVPPSALGFTADGVPNALGVLPWNPTLFQVATSASFLWPDLTATLAPGGGPGPALFAGGGGGTIAYGGGVKAFGGPARFALAPGPAAGTHRVPPNPGGPVATAWINVFSNTPISAMTVGVVGASNPVGLAAQGASALAPPLSSSFLPVVPGFGSVNAPVGGVGCSAWCVGPLGTIPSSTPVAAYFPANNLTSSAGFPWTTGFITVSHPSALGGPEIFFLSGTDMRVAGVGNLSLVSGSLSRRALTGPNANRAWLSLNLVPEPGAALGAVVALLTLALCHRRVRRRRPHAGR